MSKIIKENLGLWIIIFLVILFTFWKLPQTFYQQDEWQSLGHNLAMGIKSIYGYYSSPLQPLLAEGRPLACLLSFILTGLIKFEMWPIVIFAIFFHFLNSLLLFYLTEKLFNNKIVSLTAAVFLIVNSVSHQSVTWAAAIGNLPATTFILLAIIAYFEFLQKETRRKWLYLSFLFTLISILFKETGVFLFVLFPAVFVLFRKFNSRKILINNWPFITYGSLMLLVRLFELSTRTEKAAGFVSRGQPFFLSVIINTLLYPFTSLFQIFVPPLDLYQLSGLFTRIQYRYLLGSPLTDLVSQTVTADLFSFAGSVCILLLLAIFYSREKNQRYQKNIIFILIMFFLSFLPYAVLHREFSYMSSRYYYIGVLSAGILFGYIINEIITFNKRVKWPVLLIVIIYFFYHASVVRGDINYQVVLGNERKFILNSIKNDYPKIEKDNIFYFTSDKQFLGEVTNPFQSGLGYILEVWYWDSGQVPKSFLKDNWLWDLGAEGYKKEGEYGFGYFQDLEEMGKLFKTNRLSVNIIHAYYYDTKNKKILNINKEIRSQMATFSGLRK